MMKKNNKKKYYIISINDFFKIMLKSLFKSQKDFQFKVLYNNNNL